MTDLSQISFNDLELIAQICKSLVSVKIGDSEILELVGFFRSTVFLEEFSGGCFNNDSEEYANLAYPPRLCRLGLNYTSTNEMPIVYPFASRLKKLDLLYALLDTEDHCVLLQRCLNLEVLEVHSFCSCFITIC
ncbi:putative leucine-rich repeat domain superfamily [Helianthus anomalus]